MSMLCLIAFLLLGFVQGQNTPQNAPPTAANGVGTPANLPAIVGNSPTSADPVERLEIARRVNGLSGPDVQPWHVQASYEAFDSDGNSKDQGTFEEWWVSDRQYKLSYHGNTFSQDEYGTDHGIFHTGDPKWPSGSLSMLQGVLVQPIPVKEDLQDWGQRNLERKLGQVEFSCTAFSNHGGTEVDENSASLCFEPTKTILVYENSAQRSRATVFNHFVQFRNRYVARDRSMFFEGRSSLTLHIDHLESLDDVGRAALKPPVDATLVTRRVSLLWIESGPHCLKKVHPEYPIAAKWQHVQGKVVLWATVDQNGHVIDVHDVIGPQLLQKAATDAVRQWIFKPYLLDGKAIEFETTIQVFFNLGSR